MLIFGIIEDDFKENWMGKIKFLRKWMENFVSIFEF